MVWRRLLVVAGGLAVSAIGQHASTWHARSVRFVYELENRGRLPLEHLELRLVLPSELPRQEIKLLRVGAGGETVRDGHGNRVAVFKRRRLEPGATFTGQWFATVRLQQTSVLGKRRVEPLDPEKRALYLRDRPAYRLHDPRITRLAQAAVAGVDDDLEKAARLHDLVLERLDYFRDGRWDPAPVCLARGEGSCTEYAYLFIALCRAASIPARWVGGTALRDSRGPAYVDSVFHRWAEVWLPSRGWFPVDCSRNDGEEGEVSGRRRRYFGRVAWPLLVLARGDSGEESLTGESYHARGIWSGAGGSSKRRGFWTRPVASWAFRAMADRFAAGAQVPRPDDPALQQAWLFLRQSCPAPSSSPPVLVPALPTRRPSPSEHR